MNKVLAILCLIAGGLLLPAVLSTVTVMSVLWLYFFALVVGVVLLFVAAVKLNRLAEWMKKKFGTGFGAFLLAGFLPAIPFYCACFLAVLNAYKGKGVEGLSALPSLLFLLAATVFSVLTPIFLLIERSLDKLVKHLPPKEKRHLHNPYLEIEDTAPIEETVVVSDTDANIDEVEI